MYTGIRLRCPPFNAIGTPPHPLCIYNITLTPLLAQPSTPLKKCTLGSVEAQARTDARSDHAVLDFLVTFFIKKKGKDKKYMYKVNLPILT